MLLTLPSVDADGESIVSLDQCVGCDGDGYYYADEWERGEIVGFKKVKCLCQVIEDMDNEANQRVKEDKENL